MKSNGMNRLLLVFIVGILLYATGCGKQENANNLSQQSGPGGTTSSTPPLTTDPAGPVAANPTVNECLQSIARTACPMFCLTTPVVCSATYQGKSIPITASACNECMATASVESEACKAGYTILADLKVSCP